MSGRETTLGWPSDIGVHITHRYGLTHSHLRGLPLTFPVGWRLIFRGDIRLTLQLESKKVKKEAKEYLPHRPVTYLSFSVPVAQHLDLELVAVEAVVVAGGAEELGEGPSLPSAVGVDLA